MADLRENDICHWSWKEGMRPIVGCYSHVAVVRDGKLFDTYWHGWETGSSSIVELDRVELTALGNIDDCTEIKAWDADYYAPTDIIDMRHANTSNAPIYLKNGSMRSQEWMLQRVEQRFNDAQRKKESAERDISRLQDVLKKIRAGDLEVTL